MYDLEMIGQILVSTLVFLLLVFAGRESLKNVKCKYGHHDYDDIGQGLRICRYCGKCEYE